MGTSRHFSDLLTNQALGRIAVTEKRHTAEDRTLCMIPSATLAPAGTHQRIERGRFMGMREVRVYDGAFPTVDQIYSGDPDAVFPKESWLKEMHPGEFAVRYKDFKTGLARNPAGEHVQSSELCRVFGSLDEAREDSRKVANEHWTVRCFIYDHHGSQVDTISNNKEVGKFAASMYAGILLWVAVFAIVGMGLIWIILKTSLFIIGPPAAAQKLLPVSSWLAWVGYAASGFFLAVIIWLARTRMIAGRRVSRMNRNLGSVLSPEDHRRFAELNILHGSKDPAERERFLKLASEYREKVREALKK